VLAQLMNRALSQARAQRLLAALLAALLLLLVLVLGLLRYLAPDTTGTKLGVADVLSLAKQGRITDGTLLDEDSMLVGRAEPAAKGGPFTEGGDFSASLPSDGSLTVSLTAALSATGAQVRVDDQDGKERARLLLTAFIPVLLLADLVALGLLLARHQDRSASEPLRAAQPRRLRSPDPVGRQRTALHEAAHAVVAAGLGGADRVQLVSMADDRTAVPPLDGNGPASAGELHNRLATLLAGPAAERALLGEITTRSEGDLEDATALAHDMVARWGMSDVLGPMRLLARSGRDRAVLADLSPATREALDAEVRRLLLEAQTTAESVVVRHRDVVERLADRLLRADQVEGRELRDLLDPVVHPVAAAAGLTG